MSGVFQNIDPHPLTARRVCTHSPLVRGEDTLAGWRSLFWKTPDTALYIGKYFLSLNMRIRKNICKNNYKVQGDMLCYGSIHNQKRRIWISIAGIKFTSVVVSKSVKIMRF
jgi:hypothetical protein